jgi:hypothetical protein
MGQVTERAGVFILLSASVHAGHRGQGLVRRQVTARQPGGAGQLAEEGNPGVSLLSLLPPTLREFGVNGQRRLFGQAQHLRVGLARELAQDEGLGAGRVGVGQAVSVAFLI